MVLIPKQAMFFDKEIGCCSERNEVSSFVSQVPCVFSLECTCSLARPYMHSPGPCTVCKALLYLGAGTMSLGRLAGCVREFLHFLSVLQVLELCITTCSKRRALRLGVACFVKSMAWCALG